MEKAIPKINPYLNALFLFRLAKIDLKSKTKSKPNTKAINTFAIIATKLGSAKKVML